ncbi:MAG: hypothetical protein ACE5E9_12615 [Nitrospinaceae bacterium]
MSLTAITTSAVAVAAMIVWLIIRSERSAGRARERLDQKIRAEKNYEDINQMDRRVDREMLEQLNEGAGDDGRDPRAIDRPWVRRD